MNNIVAGFIAIAAVLFFSLEGSLSAYMQVHSLVIVLGGTVAILIFANPGPVLASLKAGILDLFKQEKTTGLYREEIVRLADNKDETSKSAHPLISYAQELWNQGVDPELFIVLLSQRRKEIDAKKADAVQALKNLAKYPPTLGMTGTVIGMIQLFSALDENKSNIGSALSVAMTATFFGLVLANLLIAPLADRLHVRQIQQHRVLDHVYELLLLINQGEPTALIKEELNERVA